MTHHDLIINGAIKTLSGNYNSFGAPHRVADHEYDGKITFSSFQYFFFAVQINYIQFPQKYFAVFSLFVVLVSARPEPISVATFLSRHNTISPQYSGLHLEMIVCF